MTHEERLVRVGEHECAHTAAALLLNLRVKATEASLTEAGDGTTWVMYASDGSDTRAMALMTLVGEMCVTRDSDDGWPPSYDALRTPTDRASSDHNRLAVHVKSMGLDSNGYRRLVGEALRLATSSEFVELHTALTSELFRRGGRLEEGHIEVIAAKARKPAPPPPEDAERDSDGVITDAQVDKDIDQFRASRVIASNGDGGTPASEPKALLDFKTAAEMFEAGLVEAATFARR
jgi:hypothetical protein